MRFVRPFISAEPTRSPDRLARLVDHVSGLYGVSLLCQYLSSSGDSVSWAVSSVAFLPRPRRRRLGGPTPTKVLVCHVCTSCRLPDLGKHHHRSPLRLGDAARVQLPVSMPSITHNVCADHPVPLAMDHLVVIRYPCFGHRHVVPL